jgi:nucleotide-binding universal stress UspA family protein
MQNDQRVLACVDRSRFAEPVADAAAWAAPRMRAPLEFLHVISRHPPLRAVKDHSGAIGLDAQEQLLRQLSEEDERRTRKEREAGRLFLDLLRQRARAAGADTVDVRLRHGTLDETLHELQSNVGLFVLGRRGAAAETTQRDLGRNVEWAIRAVNRPILAVTDTFVPPTRVLFAFDGSAITRRGVGIAAGSTLLEGLPVHLLLSGKEKAQAPRLLDAARAELVQAGFSATAEIQLGDPETVLAQAIRKAGYDLLVMGGYSHSPVRSLFFGSRTSDLLRSLGVPTLLLR